MKCDVKNKSNDRGKPKTFKYSKFLFKNLRNTLIQKLIVKYRTNFWTFIQTIIIFNQKKNSKKLNKIYIYNAKKSTSN